MKLTPDGNVPLKTKPTDPATLERSSKEKMAYNRFSDRLGSRSIYLIKNVMGFAWYSS